MLLLQSTILLYLTSSEESKLCKQLSLPTVVLLSSVSPIFSWKIKLFKMATRLLIYNIYIYTYRHYSSTSHLFIKTNVSFNVVIADEFEPICFVLVT